MYRGHLLSMNNASTKYNDCHSETFQDIERTWFFIKRYCDLDLWPADLKGVINWPWPIFLPRRMTTTHKLFKILSVHGFCIKWYCGLDLWINNLKMCRGHLLSIKWPIFLPSNMTVTQKLFKILSGYDVANGRTDRRTDGRTPYHNTFEVLLWAYKKHTLFTVTVVALIMHSQWLSKSMDNHYWIIYFD